GNFIGAAAAHEAGHGFGLQHQSVYDSSGTKLDEYSHGDALSAPIMGYGYAPRNTWWEGPSSISAGSIQNDVAVISSLVNGFGYRPDDYPDSPMSGAALGGSGTNLSSAGVIEKSTDQDWFSFTTGGGSVAMRVDVAPKFA